MATFEPLDEGEAARAEALILGELAGKTYFQVERLAWRAALAVAPDVAARRRSAAERERARVTVFREESGAVAVSGRDLPAAPALSGHANVLARARHYQASGAFPGHSDRSLQALAYLHLLNGVTAEDAIAFARTATAEPPDSTGPDDTGPDQDDEDSRGEAGSAGSAGTPGDSQSHGDDPGHDDNGGDPDDGPGPDGGDGGSGADAPGDSESHGDGQGPDSDGGDPDGGSGRDGGKAGSGADAPGDSDSHGDDPGPDGDGGDPDGGPGPGGGAGAPGGAAGQPALPEVTAPLATLLGRAERPGDNRLLGPLDPAVTRDLAAAAARSPYSRWAVTIVDGRGYAVGHGIARPRHRRPQEPQPPGPASCALPARVNITVTEILLRQLAAQAAQPRSGAPPGNWQFAPRKIPEADHGPDGHGTWTLTLPGGRELTVRFDVVPTHGCDHRYQASGYQPGERLRRLVQVRDHTWTFPPCSRPARESDFEHAVPYHQGGRTCACNAGARSRRCHQVKQMRGWHVSQPKPGWHVWTTPTGRTYVREPWRYTA